MSDIALHYVVAADRSYEHIWNSLPFLVLAWRLNTLLLCSIINCGSKRCCITKEFITFLWVSFIDSTNPSTHNTVGLVFSNHSSTTETAESGSMYTDLSVFFVTVYVQHWLNKSSAQLICEKKWRGSSRFRYEQNSTTQDWSRVFMKSSVHP